MPCPASAECARLRGHTPYVSAEIRLEFSRAQTSKTKCQSEVARRAPRTFSGCCLPGDQPFARREIDSPSHPGTNSCCCTGAELQAEPARPIPPTATQLYHRRGGAGNQRGLR